MTETTDEQVPTTVPLAIADRCDQCSSQALVRYLLAFSPLDFCGHHAGKNHDALVSKGFVIDQDIRGKVK